MKKLLLLLITIILFCLFTFSSFAQVDRHNIYNQCEMFISNVENGRKNIESTPFLEWNKTNQRVFVDTVFQNGEIIVFFRDSEDVYKLPKNIKVYDQCESCFFIYNVNGKGKVDILIMVTIIEEKEYVAIKMNYRKRGNTTTNKYVLLE